MTNQTAPIWKKCIALVAVLAVLVALLPGIPMALADDDDDEIEIELNLGKANGKGKGGSFKMPGAPYISRGHFMAPLAAIANQLDCTVAYNAANKTLTLSRGDDEIVMTIGSRICWVNGKKNEMPAAPVANRGTAFVPIKFVVSALFDEVELDFKWGRLKIKVKHHHRDREGWADDDEDDEIGFEVVRGASLEDKAADGLCIQHITREDLTSTSGLDRDDELLAVIRGWCSSTGYSIETRKLVVQDGKLMVYVDLKNPPTDSFNATVMTYVHQVIKLEDELPEYRTWEMYTSQGRKLASSDDAEAPDGQLAFEVVEDESVHDGLRDLNISGPVLLLGTAGSLLQDSELPVDTPVLAAVRGWCRSSGYTISVQSLKLENGTLVATVELTEATRPSLQVLTWVDQILVLPKNMPVIKGWRIVDSDGDVISNKTLQLDIPVVEAESPDLSWVNRRIPGIESKLVTVNAQQKLLVVIKRGVCPTSGYDIQVTDLTVDTYGSIAVDAVLKDPLPSEIVSQVVTAPLFAFYLDPAYAGHQIKVERLSQPKDGWTNPEVVDASLKASIDKTERRLLTGYGWQLLANPGDLRDDFLVVVFRGECRTGGYTINVEEFIELGDVVRVVVEEKDPAPGSVVTTALTYPYQIVKAPADTEKLAFELYPENPQQIKFELITDERLKSSVDVTQAGAVWLQGKDLFRNTRLSDDWFLLVKRGFCQTAGYDLEVDGVQIVDGILQVLVRPVNPTGDFQASVVTYPYVVLRFSAGMEKLPVQLIRVK